MKKQKGAEIILGIDPGIADTGYGLIRKMENGEIVFVACGSIKTRAGEAMAGRLYAINRELGEIIKKYRPNLAAVEQLFFCANVKTALAVGQARGVVLLTACQHRLAVAEFTPLQVKQAVSSYGQATKLQVGRMVKLLLKLDKIPKPDDAADALAVAICAANYDNTNITNYTRMTRMND